MPKRMVVFAALIHFVVLPGAACAQGETAGELIDRILQAYGGEQALSSAVNIRQSGRLTSFSRGGAEAVVTRTLQRPLRLRMEIAYPGEALEVRILAGENGWKNGAAAPPPLRLAMMLQAARIALPLLLRERQEAVIDLGRKPSDQGEMRRFLQVPLAEGTSLTLEVDEERALIRRSLGVMSMAGQAMTFEAHYSDFRSWQGILVAAREDQFAMGRPIGYTVIDKVDFPTALPEQSFQP